ncbi:stress-induced protein [Rhizobium sp. ARZ01]|uniref:KGG domain-containing protein n=1 Tax=Rhizobium sp. ARZ01 TaxID=2769313 RepID=UPI00177D90F8|nr:stress-induced protein [Rhizobium sp. ARZ01]
MTATPGRTGGATLRSAAQDKRRDVASKGGKESGGNFKNDPERAAEAGKKGGRA